ncbi:chorismate mutase [Acidithiobacillus sulfurivorans]|uniref:chorismate mutase n=1 Tax=Acidithiobacillus sulfurivorans TaxID=1958756 RepID=UPI001C06AEC9
MSNTVNCASIEEVRSNIDRIDRQIVALLAKRGRFVKQAAGFKKTAEDVKAPQRVEQVISRVTALSQELGANPSVTEQVYRAMISGFIDAEITEHAHPVSTSLDTQQPLFQMHFQETTIRKIGETVMESQIFNFGF